MADLTVDGLGELTSPAANDEIGIWDVSAGQYLKIQRSTLVGATITGGGTIALGGYTLTVPATGTAALLATAQTLTGAKTFSAAVVLAPASTGTQGLKIDMLASNTGYPLWITQDGNNRLLLLNDNTQNLFTMYADDYGGDSGCGILVGRDTNTSKPSPGAIMLEPGNGTDYWVWVDNNGLFRIYTGRPSYATQDGGTVVGAQTSSLDSKNVIGAPAAIDEVLAGVQAGADAVRRFTYKSGAYNGEEFSGVVTDYAPRYGQDRDADHPAGKSLNIPTVIGDLLLAVSYLAERLAHVEKKMAIYASSSSDSQSG